ncbi:MAG: HAD family phosphatase [Actinomycetota bacterium]|nr:HAD family phosphatase [Actinomycetota bacterium]
MSSDTLPAGHVPLGDVRVLLCDADGCLFPSEEPAFAASTAVTNELLADLGVEKRFTPEELRAVAVGRNFRVTAVELALSFGVPLDAALALGHDGARVGNAGDGPVLTAEELERRVALERREVSSHLGRVLEPDPAVREPLTELARRFGLAVVSSSALARLDACFDATALAGLFPPEVRFSAEDSLPVPTSKPDPAVYALAGERLGVAGGQALAIEDSVTGARSAIAAGFPTIGNVLFVRPEEREGRTAGLRDAGVAQVVSSWWQLAALLGAGTPAPSGDPIGA